MKFIKKITSWQVVLFVQLAVSVFLAGITFKLNVLPTKYEAVMIAILFLLLIAMFFFTRDGKKGKHAKASIRPIIGKIVSLLLSIVMFVGSGMLAKTDGAIEAITSNHTQTTVYAVYALKSNKYKDSDDLKNKAIGVNTSKMSDKCKKAFKALKEEVTFKQKNYDSYKSSTDDLYSGKIKGLFADEAYESVMDTLHPDWQDKVEVVWEYQIKETVENTSTDAKVTKEPFTLLISGVDSRGDVSEKSRSDVDMILTIDPIHRRVLMTNIPRDYFVTIYGQGGKDKLTHSGLYGTACVEKTIENFLDIDIDYNARIGFQAVTKIIDAIGGIDIYSDKAFNTYTDSRIHIKKGMQHMDGKTALAYARERHAYTTGDRHRAANEQQVAETILAKVMRPSILSHYTDLLDAIEGTFQTNLKSSDITSLAKMQLDKGGKWTVKKSILYGESKKATGGLLMPNQEIYYNFPSKKSIADNRKYIKEMLEGKDVQIAETDSSPTSHMD